MRFVSYMLLLSTLALACGVFRGAASSEDDGCADDPGSTAHEPPPSEYYTLPGLDHGLIQSPVNILSREAEDGSHAISLTAERHGASVISNKGHTIELGFPTGISISFDELTYGLVQTHFHTPSEHQIDGMTYPMEMHVVSTAPAKDPKSPPEYLVVAMLFRMGDHNPFIDRVLAEVPTEAGQQRTTEPLTITDLFKGDEAELRRELKAFFHYRGSLTTPPYSETVEWLVLKRIFEASPEQIQEINRIEGDNARPIQMLFGRTVDE